MLIATPSGNQVLQAAAHASSQTRWISPATNTLTGRSVSSGDALGITAFYSGANLLAKTGGTLPLDVIRLKDGQRTKIDDSPIAMRLGAQPNSQVTASTFWTTILLHLVVTGNAYAVKIPSEDGINAPELWIMPSDEVSPYRLEDGSIRYRVTRGVSGTELDIDGVHVLHFKGVSFGDGLVGHSPVSALRNRLGVSLSASEYQQRFFKQGARPAGVLSVDGTLDKDSAQTIREQWHATYGGAENAHSIAVLDHGATFNAIAMSNDDAQFLEQMKFGATEIASMLNIPPAMIGAEGASLTYANAQQNDLHFLKFTLRPWLVYLQDVLNADKDFFGATTEWFPMFNTDAVIRPDQETRFKVYESGRRAGVFTVADVRDAEGLAPLDQVEKSTDQTLEYRLTNLVKGGIATVNEARNQLGLGPIAGGDELVIPEGQQDIGGDDE